MSPAASGERNRTPRDPAAPPTGAAVVVAPSGLLTWVRLDGGRRLPLRADAPDVVL